MTVASRVRRIYERRPYPSPSLRQQIRSALPPTEWLYALWAKHGGFVPARILVAGCGVGHEAFLIAQLFPKAEVVGVDFSPRSITAARRLQRMVEGAERIRFEVADITAGGLKNIVGEDFELVSCHGVLSYVTDPVRALRNFVRCMKPNGALVLGVNGEAHPSKRWRAALPGFGVDTEEFEESQRLRDILRAFESVSVYPPLKLAGQDAGYLAGDLFGPLNRALTLPAWSEICRRAGLYLLGSFHGYFAIRALLNRDLHTILLPRSRADVAELIDALQPTSFHQLVLTRSRPVEPPWNDAKKLLTQRPMLTPLYKIRWPRGGGSWRRLRPVTLKSKATKTKVQLEIPQWEVKILRESDGQRSLSEILAPVKPRVPAKTVAEAMYLLYQLAAINLLPNWDLAAKR